MRNEAKQHRVAVGPEPADRAVARPRGDLLISPQLFYGKLCFVVKDPVTLRYYRLQPVEHFLLTQFDGVRSARDLLTVLQGRFPEATLGVQDILRFVGMLHEAYLLIGEGAAHAQWLATRRGAASTRHLKELASNFLFFKIPLFQPDRLLTLMEETVGRLIFHPATGFAAVLLVVVALYNMLLNIDRLMNLPYSLLSWQNLLVMYAVFIGTKIFHEFGHGLTAKHFGGEVSSMGVMLFLFSPSFYCDTSDAWMIPSRRARLWINAGGIVVELVIAALASFVWLYTPTDGLANQVALNTMISCSVATLFFNANPLMRYDGYYFLADLLEIPNLMTKGRALLSYWAQKHLMGLKPVQPADSRRAGWLIGFCLASGVYRWTVTLAIITVLYWFFEQYGMGPIGILVAVLYVVSTILWPIGKMMRFLWKQRWNLARRIAYVGAGGAVTAAALTALAMAPWTLAIKQPLVVLSAHDEMVRVRTPGRVDAVLKDAGERVHAGEIILTLKDAELEAMLDKARSRLEQERLRAGEAAAANHPAALTAARLAIEAFDQQVALLTQRKDDLILRAPVDGVIVPPPSERSLRSIAGNYVATGMPLFRVVSTDDLEARISLPEQQAAMVKEGMAVRIRLWSDPSHEMKARVSRVSSELSDQLIHPALGSASKGEVDVKADEHGEIKSATRRSTVIISLPASASEALADGMTGRGEIVVRRTTVLGRLWRAVLDSTTPDWHL